MTDPLRWVYRRMQKTRTLLGLFEDAASIENYRRLEAVRGIPGARGSREQLAMRVTALDGQTVVCREGTTDVSVLEDTFLGLFHVPPPKLHPVRSILDLGSNIGLTIAHYATLYPEARILGVEMDRNNYELCRRNIQPYGERCSVVWGAAWICDGTVAYTGDSEWGYQVSAKGSQTVEAFSIRSLIEQLGTEEVDLVKMDIEGAEAAVLEGDLGWLKSCRCVKVEIHEPYTVEECLQDLRKAGIGSEIDTRHRAAVVAWPGAIRASDVH